MKNQILAIGVLLCGTAMSQETLLLRHPSIGGNSIAFAYGSDVWVARQDGGNVQRLTVNPDVEFNPVISPDGQWVAFSGNYEGNTDVYVVPAAGGQPRRLTWHPGADVVRGWSGSRVLYASAKESVMPRYSRLFLVDAATGKEEALKMPEATQGSVSPDGKKVAYIKFNDPTDGNRNYRPFKLYRGGNMPKVWIFDNATNEVEEVPGSRGNNNTRPVWAGGNLYFLSDRDNQAMNIYRYNPAAKAVDKLTKYKDFDVKTLHTDGNKLVYEMGGRIHTMSLAGETKTLSIALQADNMQTRPRWEDGQATIRNLDISPTGLRAAIESRGEIFTAPAEKGDIRNLSNSPNAHDRSPAWSPDGKWIAWFSDAGGEYQLMLRDQKGEKEATSIPIGKKGFFFNPVWSPDSKKICYSDNDLKLYIIDIADKKPVYVDMETYDRPDVNFRPGFSSDSKWLTYTRKLKNNLRAIFLYDIAGGKSTQITDGMSEADNPAFSRDGKYLFFTASTNYGRSVGWLDMTSYENPLRNSIYAVILAKDGPSPVKPESDEETVKEPAKTDTATAKAPPAKKETDPKSVKVDLDGIQQRMVALPLPEKTYSDLSGLVEGKLLFVQAEPGGGAPALMSYDIAKRKAETLLPGVTNFNISADGKKMLYVQGNSFFIASAAGKPAPGEGRLNLADLKVWIDPRQEWAQMFDEDWRIQRDYFYVENLHGANWPAIRKRFEQFLPYVAHREDLSYLINQMNAELVIGHNYVNLGDYPDPIQVNVGMLGADYEPAEGGLRIKKIYQGLDWMPGLKPPLAQPGVEVKEGDYLLAINGTKLDGTKSIYQLMENTAGKQTRILVNSKAGPEGAREFTVIPLANEGALRSAQWVAERHRRVQEMSQGRLAYVYLPNTAGDGYTYFNRMYFAQVDKEGVVVDERFNGGGSAADYICDFLARKTMNYWKNRTGAIMRTPEAVIDGPLVMVANGYAGSGGDLLPYMFKKRQLGPVVGTTTNGILVGIYNYPVLMDGGTVTAPRLGIFSTEGKWVVENEGVTPDVEVEELPKDVIAGKDPQLEKAVELAMKQLKPRTEVKAPKDPVRAVN